MRRRRRTWDGQEVGAQVQGVPGLRLGRGRAWCWRSLRAALGDALGVRAQQRRGLDSTACRKARARICISGPELASSAELGTRCLALAAASGRMRSGKFLECCSELYPAAGRKFRQLGC